MLPPNRRAPRPEALNLRGYSNSRSSHDIGMVFGDQAWRSGCDMGITDTMDRMMRSPRSAR